MLPLKKEFSQSVVANIGRLSRLLFNIHSDDEFLSVFGIDKSALELTIYKIIDHFEDAYFNELTTNHLRELESILAKEFIFFQMQEKNNKDYQKNLSHFANIFCRDIRKRFKGSKKTIAKMKEE